MINNGDPFNRSSHQNESLLAELSKRKFNSPIYQIIQCESGYARDASKKCTFGVEELAIEAGFWLFGFVRKLTCVTTKKQRKPGRAERPARFGFISATARLIGRLRGDNSALRVEEIFVKDKSIGMERHSRVTSDYIFLFKCSSYIGHFHSVVVLCELSVNESLDSTFIAGITRFSKKKGRQIALYDIRTWCCA